MAWDLIADIGGTNMRFAVLRDGEISKPQTYKTPAASDEVSDAVSDFCGQQKEPPANIVVAAAGIIADGEVVLTNTGTHISEAQLQKVSNGGFAKILNDFEAAAWSLAEVHGEAIQCLQGDGKFIQGPRVAIGPGTGLGVGGLVFDDNRPVVIKGEGGHVRISPETNEEHHYFEAFRSLKPDFGIGDGAAIEAEGLLSGTGLPFFYQAICNVHDVNNEPWKAAEIFEAARNGDDDRAEIAIKLFTKYLGAVAGDMGVVFAAHGGVFLVGGVIAANQWIFETSNFLTAFNSGGRHTKFRENIPVYLNASGQFGLDGVANYLKFR